MNKFRTRTCSTFISVRGSGSCRYRRKRCTFKDTRKMCFKLTHESVNGRRTRARIDEEKEFHSFGEDELKARELVTMRTLG
jgi:hypothetical protein